MKEIKEKELSAVGYLWLIDKFGIKVIPPYRYTYITSSGRGRSHYEKYKAVVILPKSYALKDPSDPVQQLVFAIKHEGILLDLLRGCFSELVKTEIAEFIKATPTGKYQRIIWFLYEFLTKQTLPLTDMKQVPYIDLLDPKKYYVAKPIKSQRHAINNNMLGNEVFCPIVRRTQLLENYIKKNLTNQTMQLINSIDPTVLSRATNYLYTKETKSSFGIEHIKPDIERTTKFIGLLEKAAELPRLSKEILISLQNALFDKAYQDEDYRDTQNYVGELTITYQQKIHYIPPKPEDIKMLMSGFLKCESQLIESNVHPVLIAAILAFGFVFLHPFEDGNGRIHRFIIHYVLSKTKFTPENIIFPVSAVMLKNIRQYDEMLELLSKPLLQLITDYELNDDGELTVNSDTIAFYQYIDYTFYAEYLFSLIEKTIHSDFEEELVFIANYDKTKASIQQIVDMPDQKIDSIIRCIAQNNGKLGSKKRNAQFKELSDAKVKAIEEAVRKGMLQ